jgi:aminopeptidase N
VSVRSGWTLAEAATAFFPLTSLHRSTVDRAAALIADESLEPSLRRSLVDSADELRRRVVIRERFGRG